jgi:hypothetical protein
MHGGRLWRTSSQQDLRSVLVLKYDLKTMMVEHGILRTSCVLLQHIQNSCGSAKIDEHKTI